MDERLEIAKRLKGARAERWCLVGFDGVTDELLEVVDIRKSATEYEPIPTLEALGKRILAAAGKSCNLELVLKTTKVGGNGPILAGSLVKLGQKVTLAGMVGEAAPEPVFAEMAEGCEEVILLGRSAHTQALEFTDGKVMLGRLEPFAHLNWSRIEQVLPIKGWIERMNRSDLIASVGWTLLPWMNTIWEGFLKEVVPSVKGEKRYWYIDLSDPAKRTAADLKRGMELIKELGRAFKVVLGVNDSEQAQVAAALGVKDEPEAIRKALALFGVTSHAAHRAQLAIEGELFEYPVPTATRPKVMTGAGDNFNAGFIFALLQGYSPKEALVCGIGNASAYVRSGKSPTPDELAQFMTLWHGGNLK
ncbi:MAG: PfkB family carbohydrate kinase [Parachlamydiales bacterium]